MSIYLGFADEQKIQYSPSNTSIKIDVLASIFNRRYKLQNIPERKVLSNLKTKENNSWIFRFDYITQRYYLTIKKDDEYINHVVYYYNKKTDEVIDRKKYSSLEEYLKEMKNIYNFDLSKQVIM